MAGMRALFPIEITTEADTDAVADAAAAARMAWQDDVEAMIRAAGMPVERSVTARVVPSPELLEVLASGRAFVVRATPLTWRGAAAKDFAPHPVTIVTDPPDDAEGGGA